jgi:hypothetical protein
VSLIFLINLENEDNATKKIEIINKNYSTVKTIYLKFVTKLFLNINKNRRIKMKKKRYTK